MPSPTTNHIVIPNIDASAIYEGGSIAQITAEELKDNIIAIKQLINSHNLIANEGKNKDKDIQSYKSEIEYLKTSPFFGIIAAFMNIVGSILIGVSTNLITSDSQNINPTKNSLLLVCGVLLVLISSLGTILYPFARKWFNG